MASGIKSYDVLNNYLSRIDTLCQLSKCNLSNMDQIDKAKALFDWLWNTKPNRYEYGGKFKLTEVIDAQLDPFEDKIGNCLGLTLLYNILSGKLGVETKAVYLEEAFGRQSHVFSTMEIAGITIDIDHISPNGFNFEDHIGNPQRTLWQEAHLIADIYHSIAWGMHEHGDLMKAVHNYSKAIYLNPKYEKAHLNRGIALSMLGKDEEAMGEFDYHWG